jgi:5-formyltetrahydrofolate cyclo-ligase
MIARRLTLAAPDAASATAQACSHLVSLARSLGARRIALYGAMDGELDPREAADALRRDGATLCFPRVAGRRKLSFHIVDDPADLVANRLGIPEPSVGTPEIGPAELDLIVAPGLAFDRTGGRVGWGGGYYDATLASVAVTSAGLFYSVQLIDQVPRAAYDHPVDYVVCELGAWPSAT